MSLLRRLAPRFPGASPFPRSRVRTQWGSSDLRLRRTFEPEPAELRRLREGPSFFRDGANVLALHGTETDRGQFMDVGIVEFVEVPRLSR